MKRVLITLLLLLPPLRSSLAAPPKTDSLSVKIGQMLMVGFRGIDLTEAPLLAEDIRKRRIGGVVLFDYDVPSASPVRNIESAGQVKRLVGELQAIAPIPLFVAVDQEGGRIRRLKSSRGFPTTASAAHLGRLDNPDSTRQAAATIAGLLRSLKINVNFAPVVDLNTNPDNPVIGKLERSFSDRPDVVVRQARIFVDEFHAAGIVPVLKHFPGHGSSTQDTHKDFTDVTASWSKRELDPYRELVGQGYDDGVMTAHVFNARLDSLNPATLSRAIVDGVLRREIGFKGVVFSDDMQMRAISDRYGLERAIRLAIEAGVDVLLFGNNVVTCDPEIAGKASNIIRKLVEEGVVSRERIDRSYRRIMKLKLRINPART